MTLDKVDLHLINNPITYRPILTIPKKVNFGIELEFENVDVNDLEKRINSSIGSNWTLKKDKSLDFLNSVELVSPVLQNQKQTWIMLKKLGELLNKIKPTYENCSFQINYDGSLLPTLEDKIRFFKLYAMYEDIIYRFSKGEDETFRNSLQIYAYPIMLSLKDIKQLGDDAILEKFSDNKRYGIVYKTKSDLIEFRTPNGTHNPILWQNYITTFYYLIKAATSNKYNKKEVDKYIDEFFSMYMLEKYEQLRLDKAIDFTNLIFNSQIDQTYFLHQYMKK
jgi:hypothetical protein